MKQLPTVERVRECFRYDPTSGLLVRVVGSKGGPSKGHRQSDRRRVRLDYATLTETWVIWVLQTGQWPSGHIDHINGDPRDNRWSNLRDVSRVVNMQNQRKANTRSKTGLLGAFPHQCGKFSSSIVVDGKTRYIGLFKTALEAHEAYVAAKRALHEGCTI